MSFCPKCNFLLNIQKTNFFCNNCHYSKGIEEGAILYRESFYNNNYEDLSIIDSRLDESIMPRTKDFICPNKKCISHKNGKDKEAIFYRPYKDSHQIKYICKDCKVSWKPT